MNRVDDRVHLPGPVQLDDVIFWQMWGHDWTVKIADKNWAGSSYGHKRIREMGEVEWKEWRLFVSRRVSR